MSSTSGSGAGAAGNAAPAPPRGNRPTPRRAAAAPTCGCWPPCRGWVRLSSSSPRSCSTRPSSSSGPRRRTTPSPACARGRRAWTNYAKVLAHPDLGTVLVNTVVWVVAVLVLSLVISLGLAQLLGKEFFGRKAGALGGDHPVGGVPRHHRPAVHAPPRLQLRHRQPVPARGRDPRHADRLPRRRPLDDAVDDRRRGVRHAAVHHLRPARRAQGDPGRRVRGRPRRRRVPLAGLHPDHPAAAATRAARSRAF